MSHVRRLLLWSAVAAALGVGGARPGADVPRMELAEVLGRTACPLAVRLDEDPLRLPRRIKLLTCAPGPAAGAAACCRRGDAAARCVEVLDDVVVQYLPHAGAPAAAAPRHVLQVPVGCVCVAAPATRARDDR